MSVNRVWGARGFVCSLEVLPVGLKSYGVIFSAIFDQTDHF
jgi:hypothetical protein